MDQILRRLSFKISVDGARDASDSLRDVDKSGDKLKDRFGQVAEKLTRAERAVHQLAGSAKISNEQMRKLIQTTKEETVLDKEFNKAARAAGLMGNEVNQLKSKIKSMHEQTASWVTLFKGLAAAGVFAGLFGLGKAGLTQAAQLEDTTVQFEVLLKSAAKAKTVLADLRQWTAKTPFNSDEATKVGRQLLAVNVPAEELIDHLNMIGNVAKGSGKNFEELGAIMAKNKSARFIQGEDLNQLIESGIPILQEFEKITGRTAIQVKDMASKNQIEYKHLLQAFRNMTKEGGTYFNMMGRLSETTIGMFSTFSDDFMTNIRKIMAGVLFLTRPILKFFTDGERGSTRLQFAMVALALAIGVGLVSATWSWYTALNAVAVAKIAAFGEMIAIAVAIAAAFTAVYLVFEDIYTFFEYGPAASESFFEDFLRWLGLTDSELEFLSAAFKEFKEWLGVTWDMFKVLADSPFVKFLIKASLVVAAITAAIVLWPVTLAVIGTAIASYIYAKWDAIKRGWESFKSFMQKALYILGQAIIIALFPLAALYIFRNELKGSFKSAFEYLKKLPFVQWIVDQFYSIGPRINQAIGTMSTSVSKAFMEMLPVGSINEAIDLINYGFEKISAFTAMAHNYISAIPAVTIPQIPRIEARAAGGPVKAGVPYLVGEKGPELRVFSQPGSIIPNDAIRNTSYKPASSQMPSITVTIEKVQVSSDDPSGVAEGLFDAILKEARERMDEIRIMYGLKPKET